MPLYYEDEDAGIQIWHGDCREILPGLTCDLVLTDPPFGVGKAEWDAEFPGWDSLSFLAASECLAIMPGVVNVGGCPARLGALDFRWMLSAYLRNGMTRGALGFGNWIPALVYASDEVSLYGPHQDAGAFSIGGDPKPDHECPKPLNVMRWMVARLPGDVVCDPFMGSGTTLRAAKDEGRKAIGIEIEERYCEIAARRLAQGVLDFG